ncbi:MAG: glycosyltransferase [Bacteroidota bacterium]
MKIAFICVNYNNFEFTREYIKSIEAIKGGHEVTVVVVDNASDEKDVKAFRGLDFSRHKLILSPENVGYFKGLNKGIDAITIKEYDYVLIGNNDLTFAPNFLIQLQDIETASDVLVLAPNIIREDGVHQNPHITSKFSKIQRIYRRIYYSHYAFAVLLQRLYNVIKPSIAPEDRIGHDLQQEILMGYGACYLLTHQFFNHFKRLDAPFFLMGEEPVLANQVLSVDGKTLYMPNLIVHHHDHASIGKVPVRKLYEFSRQSYQHYLKNLKNIQ